MVVVSIKEEVAQDRNRFGVHKIKSETEKNQIMIFVRFDEEEWPEVEDEVRQGLRKAASVECLFHAKH